MRERSIHCEAVCAKLPKRHRRLAQNSQADGGVSDPLPERNDGLKRGDSDERIGNGCASNSLSNEMFTEADHGKHAPQGLDPANIRMNRNAQRERSKEANQTRDVAIQAPMLIGWRLEVLTEPMIKFWVASRSAVLSPTKRFLDLGSDRGHGCWPSQKRESNQRDIA